MLVLHLPPLTYWDERLGVMIKSNFPSCSSTMSWVSKASPCRWLSNTFVIWSPCLPSHFSKCLSLPLFTILIRFQSENSTNEQEHLRCLLRMFLIKWVSQRTKFDLWVRGRVSTFTWRSFRVLFSPFKQIVDSLLLSVTREMRISSQVNNVWLSLSNVLRIAWFSVLYLHCSLFSQNNWEMFMKGVCGGQGRKGIKILCFRAAHLF